MLSATFISDNCEIIRKCVMSIVYVIGYHVTVFAQTH